MQNKYLEDNALMCAQLYTTNILRRGVNGEEIREEIHQKVGCELRCVHENCAPNKPEKTEVEDSSSGSLVDILGGGGDASHKDEEKEEEEEEKEEEEKEKEEEEEEKEEGGKKEEEEKEEKGNISYYIDLGDESEEDSAKVSEDDSATVSENKGQDENTDDVNIDTVTVMEPKVAKLCNSKDIGFSLCKLLVNYARRK